MNPYVDGAGLPLYVIEQVNDMSKVGDRAILVSPKKEAHHVGIVIHNYRSRIAPLGMRIVAYDHLAGFELPFIPWKEKLSRVPCCEILLVFVGLPVPDSLVTGFYGSRNVTDAWLIREEAGILWYVVWTETTSMQDPHCYITSSSVSFVWKFVWKMKRDVSTNDSLLSDKSSSSGKTQ